MIANPNNAAKRLKREVDDLRKNPISGMRIIQNPDDIFHMTAFMDGPPDSPYSRGEFELDITFPVDYPFKAPYIVFKQQVFHPNVNGFNICLDILDNAWSPALKIQQVLLSISSLLVDPSPDNGYGNGATELLLAGDQEGFNTVCREWVELYALKSEYKLPEEEKLPEKKIEESNQPQEIQPQILAEEQQNIISQELQAQINVELQQNVATQEPQIIVEQQQNIVDSQIENKQQELTQ